jgi:RNA polymerase primary sigma factor
MRAPTVDEIAKELHMAVEEVSEILHISASPVSLDSEINEDKGTILDILEDYSYAPEIIVLDQSVREETINSLGDLQDRERNVLERRFALDGGERQTLKTISDELGVSPETVRQIEIRALRKLRRSAEYLKELMLN